MKRDNVKMIYPLSSIQEGMLFHKLYDQANTSYHIQNAFWVNDEINEKMIRDVLLLLAYKHEVLKTSFMIPKSTGRPWQVILKEKEIELTIETCAQDEEDYVQKVKENDLKRGFDLQNDSLFRLHVVSFSDVKHYFLFSFSHIIMDGWCISLLFGDFLRYYEALNSGISLEKLKEIVDREKASQGEYKDYIDWVNKQDKEGALQYWEQVLAGYEGNVEIEPTEQIQVGISVTEQEELILSKEITKKLGELAVEKQVTMNTIAEVMIGILLQRYCFLDDVVFGKVVSGRNAKIKGIERIVGLFINTVPTRIQCEKGMTVSKLLNQVQKQGEESSQYDFCELSSIQANSKQGSKLIQVIFAFENYFFDEENMKVGEHGLHYAMESEREETNYDITFSAHVAEEQLVFHMLYQTGRFGKQDIKRMLQHLECLFVQAINQPDMLVEDMVLATQEEQVVIKEKFNDTTVPYPDKETVVALFEEQVTKTPDRIAVVFEDVSLTYGELNRRSNVLAHKLRNIGLKPEEFVAILSQRSTEVVVGILGILKAGGAYLPIDDSYPDQRKLFVLEDCNVKAVLNYRAHIPVNVTVPVISLEAEDVFLGEEENPERVNKSEDLAYCIYTSGTTGKGKGVLIEHKNIIKLVKNQDYTVLNEDTRILQTGQLAFDASTFEIWGSILNGGQVHLIAEETLLDMDRFKEYLRSQKINTLFMTTALFNQFITEDITMFDTLEHFMFGGEKTSEKCVAFLMGRNTVPDVRNVYGPTETTTFATHYVIDGKRRKKTPIGKPIANTKAYVLNGIGLCGIGVPGELCLAGDGVARGYLNRKDLTEEKFIKNPFGKGKLYRSGDLVRWLPDGNIEFIGRIDEQVKIRGFRIELGEISEVIRSMDGIRETAVIIDTENDEKNICAYIVSDTKVDLSQIRTYVRKKLPEYMVPQYMMQIDEIPMNRNGKLDKRALPKIEAIRSKEYKAPENEKEVVLCKVLEEVLGIEKAGTLDSFYELGGDSIKAIRIVSKIRGEGYSLAIKDIMECQSVEQIAKQMHEGTKEENQDEVTGEVLITPIIERFFSWNLKNPNYFNQDMLIRMELDEIPYVQNALQELAKHHDMLRAVYRDGKVQILSIKESPLCEMKEVFLEEDKDWETELQRQSTIMQASMDLENPPVLKSILFHVGERVYLFLCIHHLVVDGVSWRILLEDLSLAIKQQKEGQTVKLPIKTASYQKWAKSLKEYGESDTFKKEKQYWESVQKEVKQYGKIKGKQGEEGFGELEFRLEKEETESLLKNVGKAYHTEINDVLLSALAVAVNQWTGQEKIAIGLEGHGRDLFTDDLVIDRTVGWFTSIYPFVAEGSQDLEDTLINNKENLRKIPLHGIGYGLCQKEYLEDTPEICFNYLGQMDAEQSETEMKFCSTGKSCMDGDGAFRGVAINSMVIGSELQVTVSYDTKICCEQEVKQFAKYFKQSLQNYIVFLLNRENEVKTPSDYLLPECSMKDIKRIQEVYPDMVDMYPLTPLQEGMLYHYIQEPDSTAYVIQHEISLKGTIKEENLIEAARLLVQKHEVFRTAIYYEDLERPVQVVLGQREPEFEKINLKDLGQIEQQLQIEEVMRQDVIRGFDLAKDSLLRIKLIELSETEYKMIWCYHHIVIDGWCLSLVYGDFIQYFELLNNGISQSDREKLINSQKTELVRYRDYVKWLSETDKEKAIKFYDSLLEEYDGIAQIMPIGKPEPVKEQVNQCEIMLTKEETNRLLALAKANNTSMNTLAEAAWGITLQLYCHSDDVVFGKVVSGRTTEIQGIEKTVGFFINTVPVRVTRKEGQTLADMLEELKQNGILANQYSYCSLAQIQARTSLKQDLVKNLFVFENYELDEAQLLSNQSGIKIAMEAQREQTNYPMSVVMGITEDKLNIGMMYDPNCYEQEEIHGILRRVAEVFKEMLANPERELQTFEAVSAKERKMILEEFNATSCAYPKHKTMVELFEEQVKSHRTKTALVFGGQELTYEELDHKSNQLAAKLRNSGVKRNQLIMLLADRSLEMIIGILGIMKSGAAYLPVDVTLPEERILYMQKDSKAVAMITYGHTASNLGIPVYPLEEAEQWEESGEPLELVNQPDDLAYCIYTSGTTGLPKGVLIEHYGVANLREYFITVQNVTEKERMLQFANYAFDAFISEFTVGLLTGATLYLLEEKVQKDFGLFEKFIREKQITMAILPPQYLSQISLEQSSMRTIISAGSETTRTIVKKHACVPVYSNDYGPTEATVCATYWKHDSTKPVPERIPIGKPMINKKIYILNGTVLCGVGVPGELCIAGEGLARGYLNRPELTEEKFVENPYGEGKIYRSGDLARWLPDGTIDYIGRIDEQVKIRGYRVELGEIEERIRQFEGVKETAVVAMEQDGEKVLCGYVAGNDAFKVDALRQHLKGVLPNYMIPAYLMQIEAIPFTRNGKLDKRALPKPERVKASAYEMPKTEEECALCHVLEEVLGVSEIGLQDRFFDLGGDSIKAIRTVSKMRMQGFEVTINDIMEGLPVKETAKKIKAGNQTETKSQEEVEGEVQDSPILERFRFWDLKNPETFVQDMLISLKPGQELHVKEALTAITYHHDMLRAVYQNNKLVVLNREESKLFDYEEADLTNQGKQAMKELAAKARGSMDLTKGPLMKSVIVKNGEERYLYLCIHHFVVDGVSWRILLEDLQIGLHQLEEGKDVTLPEKTSSYQEWTEMLKEYQKSNVFKKEEAYWKQIKESIKQCGTKVAIPKQDSFKNSEQAGYGMVTVALDKDKTEQMLHKSARAFHTEINDLLLGAFGMAVKKWTGQDELAIGLESHGRERLKNNIDIDRTVGWFTAVYPYIVACKEDIEEALIENKERLRKVPNHGVLYGLVQQDMLGQEPEVSFNYLGQMDEKAGQGETEFMFFGEEAVDNDENQHQQGIAVNSMIQKGRLIIQISYSKETCGEEQVKELASYYEESLSRMITYCAELKHEVKTPSDYLLPEFTMEQIRQIQSSYKEVEDMYPLSPLQKGMLYHNLTDKESAAYNIQHVISLRGEVLEEETKQALCLLADKYEVFKTALLYDRLPEPVQIVLRDRVPECEFIDLRGMEKEQQNARFQEIKEADLRRGFSLEKDVLVRVKMVRLDDENSRMIWCYHHSIIDGWCMSLVYGDYIENYEKLRSGKSIEDIKRENEMSQNTTSPYRNFIKWLKMASQETAMEYWNHYLEDYEDIAEIKPMEIPEPSSQEMCTLDGALTREESQNLVTLAKEENVSINTVAEAAWGITLLKYCHSEDVVFGKIVSGRNAPIDGIDQMVGLFINTVPVRVRIEKGQKLTSLWQNMKADGICANQYDYCSLADIQAGTSQKQDLIKTLFVFENYYTDETRLATKEEFLTMKMEAGHEQTNYELTVVAHMKDDALHISLMYMPNVYTEQEAQLVLNHMMEIFRQIIKNPEQPVEDIDCMTKEEEKLILHDFNQTARDYPKDKTILDMLEQVSKDRADKTAVVFKEQSLTYEELNRKSNQVARKLRENGIRPNDRVMIIARRSLEMVIGICGILKAGGAYLPVDASLPDERIRYMLEDSDAKCVLVYHRPLDMVNVNVISLEGMENWTESDADLQKVNKPHDLAYCIYTSGTTGQPKGVMIEHQNLIKLVINQDYVVFDEHTRLLQTAQLAFDASAFEIWGPVLNGGTVHIIEDKMLLDCNAFKQYLIEHKINTVFMTTALFNQMVNFDSNIFDTVSYLMFGGEKASEKQVDMILERGKVKDFINLYGPTEGTTLTTHYHIKKDYACVKLPIGKPISNTQVYVMNQNKLCGIGIPGELCIAGDGVARGYLNREEYTKEKFKDNPFGPGKLYYTGDLVRWMPDGNIEFTGRIDEQVKVRGFRIELGEIANAIGNIPYVKQVVVIVRKDSIGEEAICAYIEAEQEISVSSIKDDLRGYLPDYMIPSYIMQVESIPVTSNGKVNKRLLPEPDAVHGIRNIREYEAAGNEYEEEVLKIWSSILRTSQIGINDNFFEIGGTSLLLITMQSQINEKYPDSVAIGDIFANPTIKLLAEFIERKTVGAVQAQELVFPAEYFLSSQKMQSSRQTRILDGAFYQNMKAVYEQDLEEFHSIFMLVYSYALSQVTGEESIPVLEGRNQHFSSYTCELAQSEDLNQVKVTIKQAYQDAQKHSRLHLERQMKPNGVLPAVMFEYNGNEKCQEWADFSLAFQIEKDKAVITTQLYNSQMDGNKVYQLMDVMIQMLTSIFNG